MKEIRVIEDEPSKGGPAATPPPDAGPPRPKSFIPHPDEIGGTPGLIGAGIRGLGNVSTAAVKPFFRSGAMTQFRQGDDKEQAEAAADAVSNLVGQSAPYFAASKLGGAGGRVAAHNAYPLIGSALPFLGRRVAESAVGAAQSPESPVSGALIAGAGGAAAEGAPHVVARAWQQLLHPAIKRAAQKTWELGQGIGRAMHGVGEAGEETLKAGAQAKHAAGQAAARAEHGISVAGEKQAVREARGAHAAQQAAAKEAHETGQAAAAKGHEASQAAARSAHEAQQMEAGGRHVLDAQRHREAQEAMRATLTQMRVHQIAERVNKLMPELNQFGDDLFNMSRGDAGKKAIDTRFGAVRAELDKRIGKGKLWVPEINPNEPVTLEQATEALTGIGKGIGNAKSAVARSAGQGQAAFNYGKARDEMVQALDMVSPGAGKIWDAAMRQRSAARAYMTLVSNSLDESGVLDPRKLAKNYNTFYGSLQRKLGPYYDDVTNALLAGPKGGGPVKVPGKVELAEPKPFQAEPFKETPFKPEKFKPEKFKKPPPAGIPKFQEEPFQWTPAGRPDFKAEPFDAHGRIESLLLGPQSPYAQLGNLRVPVKPPPGLPPTLGTLGAAFPGVSLGGLGTAAEKIGLPHGIPGAHHFRRRHGGVDSED